MATARRRNLAAFLEQVHIVRAGRGRAHARAFLAYVDVDRGRPRVEPGAAERRRLGQGDDGPRREGPRVRGGVRARAREGPVPRRPRAAEPGAQGELARRRAPARPRPPAGVRRQHARVRRRAAGAGGRRGASHLLRRADAGQASPLRLLGALVRRDVPGQRRRPVLPGAGALGTRRRGDVRIEGPRKPRRTRSRGTASGSSGHGRDRRRPKTATPCSPRGGVVPRSKRPKGAASRNGSSRRWTTGRARAHRARATGLGRAPARAGGAWRLAAPPPEDRRRSAG